MAARVLNDAVFAACEYLHRRPERTLASPAGKTRAKRASVAIVIGWKVGDAADYSFLGDTITTLDQLRDQPWLPQAEPHILFIKRAKREGDRWTNHVALPGGRREPDETDEEAARRETLEEVGLELVAQNSLFVGGLDQRQVTTSFGSVFLMTLCPYVYIMTQPGLSSLTLQPTEVESAHWISVAKLLDSSNRSFEYVDVSSRLARTGGPWVRKCMLHAFGLMKFCAIELKPSVSAPDNTKTQLLMWGLTLGVLTDWLNLLPPYNASALWQYPTFTAPDVAVILSLLSSRTRRSVSAPPGQDVVTGEGPDRPLDFVGRAIEPWYPNVPIALVGATIVRSAAVAVAVYSFRRLARHL